MPNYEWINTDVAADAGDSPVIRDRYLLEYSGPKAPGDKQRKGAHAPCIAQLAAVLRPQETQKKDREASLAVHLFIGDCSAGGYSMGAGFFMSQMPQGQESAQKPQAMHLSGSTTRSKPPSGSSLRLMAFCGQRVSQM